MLQKRTKWTLGLFTFALAALPSAAWAANKLGLVGTCCGCPFC